MTSLFLADVQQFDLAEWTSWKHALEAFNDGASTPKGVSVRRRQDLTYVREEEKVHPHKVAQTEKKTKKKMRGERCGKRRPKW